MSRTFLLFLVFSIALTIVFSGGTLYGYGQNSTPSNESSFAVISPAMIASLAAQASSPEAKSIISNATKELSRPPDPLAKLHVEGTLPHQGLYDQSALAEKDFPVMLNLALAYRLTGDARFLKQADTYFNAWVPLYHPSFNPIDETTFDRFIMAYDLSRSALPSTTQKAVTVFLTKLAYGYLNALESPKLYGDNWQSHRVKLATFAAFSLGDPNLISKAHQSFSKQIASNIRADGSVLDFYKRDALLYVTYDLKPLSMTCLAAKVHGEDWYHEVSPIGGSVAKGIDWLMPYASGEKTHIEFVHSTVKFDAARDKAGVPGFSGLWERRSSDGVLSVAAILDPSRRTDLEKFTASTGTKATPWLQVIFPAN